MADKRYFKLKQILESKRNNLLTEIKTKIREITDSGSTGESYQLLNVIDHASQNMNNDIEFYLVSMKNDTVKQYDEALISLAEGNYGNCYDCGNEISAKRLDALPFAVRCITCQENKEVNLALIERKEDLNRR